MYTWELLCIYTHATSQSTVRSNRNVRADWLFIHSQCGDDSHLLKRVLIKQLCTVPPLYFYPHPLSTNFTFQQNISVISIIQLELECTLRVVSIYNMDIQYNNISSSSTISNNIPQQNIPVHQYYSNTTLTASIQVHEISSTTSSDTVAIMESLIGFD